MYMASWKLSRDREQHRCSRKTVLAQGGKKFLLVSHAGSLKLLGINKSLLCFPFSEDLEPERSRLVLSICLAENQSNAQKIVLGLSQGSTSKGEPQ
jgi:hypothetical protein